MIGLFKIATGMGNMELREVPKPEPETHEVLVRVKAAGICGSDLHIHDWDTQLPMNPPMICGHEFSGVIEELGHHVTGWEVGDRVTAEPSFSVCGRCRYCRSGFYNLCPERKILGFWANGAFAEYTKVPAIRLHKLPKNVSFEEGAMLEPFACCVHGVLELTGIEPGEIAVVSGPGTIGLLAMQLLKVSGALVVVIGTGADAMRLNIAKQLGADHTINCEKDDPVRFILDLTDGVGADVVIECSGAPASVSMNLELIRKRGKYTQIGLFGKPISFDFEKIAYKEIQVTGSFAQKWSAWKRAIELVRHEKVSLKPINTDIFSLQEWEKAFRKLKDKEGLKIILKP